MKVFIIILLFFSFYVQAGIKVTTKNGKWDDPAVWGGKTNNVIPKDRGDTIIINHYIILTRSLYFKNPVITVLGMPDTITGTILSVSGTGVLCGDASLYFNDYRSFLLNAGTVNIVDLKLIRGKDPNLNTLISTNDGKITYSGTFTTNTIPASNFYIYVEGDAPIFDHYTCAEAPASIFSITPVEECQKSCITLAIPPDFIHSDTKFSWIVSDPEIHLFSGTITSQFCYLQNTTVSVKLITTNNIGTDTLIKDVKVFISHKIHLKISNDTIACENQPLQLTSIHDPQSIVWWHPNTELSCYNCDSPVFRSKKETTHTTLIAYSTNGGCRAYDTVNIQIIRNEKNFLRDTVICRQGMLTIPSLYGAGNIVWNDGSTLPSFNILTSGLYWATLTNQCGTRTDSAFVRYTVPKEYTIPNVFTPNNDGINDNFEIKGIETYDQAKLTVFNRWGTRIFQSADPFAAKWDGAKETDGVYFYSLETKDCSNIIKKENGIIELLR